MCDFWFNRFEFFYLIINLDKLNWFIGFGEVENEIIKLIDERIDLLIDM